MRAEIWRWWEKAVGTAVFSRIFSHLFPPFRSISHLFPPFPTSFLFYGQAERVGKWSVGLSERWGDRSGKTRRAGGRIYAGKSADCCAKVHESSRKFAQYRPVNPRCLASQARHKLDAPSGLFACAKRGRIVTGGSLFFETGDF